MKVQIKKIILENYKCFREMLEIPFSKRTEISGRNRAGKSTIQNAYLETLTGKELDGSSPDSVIPHDTDGNDLKKVDAVREVVLDVDGREIYIRKRTFQKWRRPRGQQEEVYDGNGVDYEIDGFPYKPEKFQEYIAQNIADPFVLLMCSNANPFLAALQKSTAEGRKILEKLAGFSVEQFIAENPQYASIVAIAKGHPVEDVFKKLRKDLSAQKKVVEAQNEKIKHEQSRPLASAGIEIADLELAKGEWREKLEELDRQEAALNDSMKAYESLSSEIISLNKRKEEMRISLNMELSNERWRIRESISKKKDEKYSIQCGLDLNNDALVEEERYIQKLNADLISAREQYKKISESEFDETLLHQIEEERFDEVSLTCPTCGQPFPRETQQEITERFEKSKSNKLHEQIEEKELFYKQKEENLKAITEKGNSIAKALKDANAAKEKLAQDVQEISGMLDEKAAEVKNLEERLDSMPALVDLSGNEEYVELKRQIADKEKEFATMNNGAVAREEIRRNRDQCMIEISRIDGQISTAQSEQENKEKILSRLESELRNMSQVMADIEKQIDMLSEFSRAKNEALAQKINPYMDGFSFRFLTYTIEGNPVETCQIFRDGTEYSDLNYSDKLIVQANMLRGFQRMQGISLPIWIDNSESINTDRIPALDTQMIVLRVSDSALKVQEMI